MTHSALRHVHRETGVTLVELLIASALAGAVAGLATLLYLGAWRNFTALVDRTTRTGRAAGGLALLAGEIRAARGIVTATPTRLDLWIADRNGDDFAQADEIVGYRIEGDRIAREAAGTRTVLLEGLAEVAWAADLPPLPPPGGRLIHIRFRFEGDEAPFATSFALRNVPTGPAGP